MLVLTARILDRNPGHARIAVWQNGGKAGELTVDVDLADQVVAAINQSTTPLDPTKNERRVAEAAEDGTLSRLQETMDREELTQQSPDVDAAVAEGGEPGHPMEGVIDVIDALLVGWTPFPPLQRAASRAKGICRNQITRDAIDGLLAHADDVARDATAKALAP